MAKSPVLVFVLLQERAFPQAEPFAARLKGRIGEQVTWEERSEKDGLAVQFFHAGSRRIDLALMPVPIPWSELEGPCATTRLWPEATEACRAHKAHLLIAVRGAEGDSPLALRVLATQVAAAAVEELGAMGVYWGAGSVVSEGSQFVQLAAGASEQDLPLLLWIDFRVWRQEDGSRYIATTGLADLGLMEIEGASRKLGAEVLLEKTYDLAHYVAQSGPVLRDGDTVGASASERIKVSHRPSVWERGQVVFLDFDGSEQKGFWGRLFGR